MDIHCPSKCRRICCRKSIPGVEANGKSRTTASGVASCEDNAGATGFGIRCGEAGFPVSREQKRESGRHTGIVGEEMWLEFLKPFDFYCALLMSELELVYREPVTDMFSYRMGLVEKIFPIQEDLSFNEDGYYM